MSQAWIPTAVQLPPENQTVETKIDNAKGCRNEGRLFRQGRLWYVPSGDMYVYYTPTHWKPIAP